MEKHIKVARAHRALTWLYGFVAVMLLLILMAPSPNSPPDTLFLGLGVIVILFVIHHLTARGARKKNPTARTASQVIAIIMLFGFPLGTFIGIYLLVNTWSPWAAPSNDVARSA